MPVERAAGPAGSAALGPDHSPEGRSAQAVRADAPRLAASEPALLLLDEPQQEQGHARRRGRARPRSSAAARIPDRRARPARAGAAGSRGRRRLRPLRPRDEAGFLLPRHDPPRVLRRRRRSPAVAPVPRPRSRPASPQPRAVPPRVDLRQLGPEEEDLRRVVDPHQQQHQRPGRPVDGGRRCCARGRGRWRTCPA